MLKIGNKARFTFKFRIGILPEFRFYGYESEVTVEFRFIGPTFIEGYSIAPVMPRGFPLVNHFTIFGLPLGLSSCSISAMESIYIYVSGKSIYVLFIFFFQLGTRNFMDVINAFQITA